MRKCFKFYDLGLPLGRSDDTSSLVLCGSFLSPLFFLFLSLLFQMSNEDSAILSAHWMLFAFLIASQISKSQGKALAFGAITQVTLSALILATPPPNTLARTHTRTCTHTLSIWKALSHPLDLKWSTSRAQVLFCMHSHYWVDKIASLQWGVWWRPGVKWMAHSLSVLQMNAPRKASRTARVHSKTPFNPPPTFFTAWLPHYAFMQTVIIIIKHSPS